MSAILRIIEVVTAFLMAAYLIGHVVWPLINRWKWKLMPVVFAASAASPVFAQNATTIGTLTLIPTFDNVGVKLTYTALSVE